VKRNIEKWSIHRDWRFGNRWVVHAPGSWLRATCVSGTYEAARLEFIRRSKLWPRTR
jgi:hypothetical protein